VQQNALRDLHRAQLKTMSVCAVVSFWTYGGPDPTDPRSVYAEAKRRRNCAAHYSLIRGLACPTARCFGVRRPPNSRSTLTSSGNFMGNYLNRRPSKTRITWKFW